MSTSRNGEIAISVSRSGVLVDPQIFREIQQKLIVSSAGEEMSALRGRDIGLTISKKLVELHGGEIDVTMNPEKKAVYRFTIDAIDDSGVLPG